MRYLILLISLSLNAQIVSNGDLTHLNDVPSNWSVGNGCGIDNYINATIQGDLILKGNCRILNATLTITGEVVYNDFEIDVVCGELIELRLSNKQIEKQKPVLYPNPTKGEFYINTNKHYKLEFFTMTGQRINKIDKAGIYIVKVIIEDKEYNYKLIKQ